MIIANCNILFFFAANKRDMKKKGVHNNNNENNAVSTKPEESELDTSGFASETTEQEVSVSYYYYCKL